MRRRAAVAVLAGLLLAVGGGAGDLLAGERGAAPADTLLHPGLEEPVEIRKDRWGISHIYAETEEDLFFAQGWNAARDRLFQLEIWRRRATGTVAEILGPRAVERDRGARLFRFRGDLERELSHYHPRGGMIVRAFVRGINAYIEETRKNPELLPLEFELLGIRPEPWTPEVVISRHQGLVGNLTAELRYGRAVARLGAERVRALTRFGPFRPELALDPEVDGGHLFREILAPYLAFRRSIEFRPEDIVVPGRRRAASEGGGRPEPDADLAGVPPGDALDVIGSNNWVVSGRRSESGYPLMANDPHRAQAAPPLRYWVHLVGPGWNVVGAGEPSIPGVSIGHNEYGAWGLTVFAVDSEDLYVYETRPGDPEAYRYRDGWERMTVIQEEIPVRGSDPVTVELKYTRHGPVVHEDPDRGLAYAVRAGWMEVGGAPYLASLRMDQARSWQEFREACTYSRIPGENMVWAGRDGTIGWQAVGVSPIRPNWSGLVPVPGDGRYEWDGFLPIRELPHTENPPEGFWATANNDMVPRDYDHPDAVGFSWAAPWRWARINEVLASGRRINQRDMIELQTDELSVPARTLVPLLAAVEAGDPRVEEARRRLVAWDRRMSRESVAAGIYAEWESRLRDRVTRMSTAEEERELLGSLPMETVVDRLLAPTGAFGGDPIAGRDELLLRSLENAVDALSRKLGSEIEGWRYGQENYKHALVRHPLSSAVDEETRRLLDVGPAPRGGYGYTVNNSGMGDNQTSGPSFRILVDTGDWDRTLGAQSPGQGGDPEGPHYDDLFPLWAADRYFPVFFSREKVVGVTEEVTVLAPGG